MSYTGDWTDWAGDNPKEAEAELRKEKARKAKEDYVYADYDCEVEGHEFNWGVCLICEEPDEDYDPTPQGEELVTDRADAPSYQGRAAA